MYRKTAKPHVSKTVKPRVSQANYLKFRRSLVTDVPDVNHKATSKDFATFYAAYVKSGLPQKEFNEKLTKALSGDKEAQVFFKSIELT